nr:hypothetical protein [Streptomyces sp. DSM 41633]
MSAPRIGVSIVTMGDRPQAVEALLASVAMQDVRPTRLVIIGNGTALPDYTSTPGLEDLDGGVDVTTVATVPEDAVITGDFTAREAGVVAGLRVGEAVLSIVCTEEFEVVRHVEDGERVAPGQKLLTVTTRPRERLTGERSALNLLCRLSG